ncbi:MAG TPA: hypothetical protein VJ246_03710 [Patescibacteria group bacterium]|nr:hypothetical protein [Patescibacteria group bacterium]
MKLVSRFFVTLVLFTTVFSGAVFAADTDNGSRKTPVPVPDAARLKDGNIQSCQVRETTIKTRSEHLVQLATTMERAFGSITTRVEDYYVSKVLSSGKSVANHDALLADIQSKKDGVQQAILNAQSDILAFSCTADNPKRLIVQFNNDMRVVKSALGLYRTAIRKLIVAIHAIVGEESKATPSLTPSPSTNSTTGKRER